jgi:hypothetical protein
MFTVEQPYPLYRSFNNPFHDKVQATLHLQPHFPPLYTPPPPQLPPPSPLSLP